MTGNLHNQIRDLTNQNSALNTKNDELRRILHETCTELNQTKEKLRIAEAEREAEWLEGNHLAVKAMRTETYRHRDVMDEFLNSRYNKPRDEEVSAIAQKAAGTCEEHNPETFKKMSEKGGHATGDSDE
ncbi:hypothetical protein HK097_010276 [Rhizophlyctis rosea]|uniref:Uncharacterized protein n=1 Tax=Rhizophlyctis rosea TaxID=64517 RepID=A0AAD5SIQ3_9FUNG|nr:hypothetical protein HK097_010276 [Rhizophlyctis rosea]